MEKFGRDTSLPNEFQGRWTDTDTGTEELNIDGCDVTCFGRPVAYDYFEFAKKDGALLVSLKIRDLTNSDTFYRANITEMVITSDGEFHAYNVKSACQWVRAR